MRASPDHPQFVFGDDQRGKIRFVALTAELLALLPLASGFETTDDYLDRLAHCVAPNVSLAMIEGGRVLCAGGVIQVWPGRGYAWFLPGAWMKRRHLARALARCRRELARLESAGFCRIECTTRAGHPALAPFVQRLGFSAEATMRRFGMDGADHVLFARLSAVAERAAA